MYAHRDYEDIYKVFKYELNAKRERGGEDFFFKLWSGALGMRENLLNEKLVLALLGKKFTKFLPTLYLCMSWDS